MRPFLVVLLAFPPALAAQGARDRGEPPEVRRARETLEKNPEDPKACATLGLYVGATLGDWPSALPFLAKSKDSTLAPAAGKESAGPQSIAGLVELGDLWSAASRKHSSHRAGLLSHACEFYGRAWDDGDDALKLKLRPKLKALLATGPANPRVVKTMPRGWHAPLGSVAGPDFEYARGGRQSIKFLPPRELSESAVASGFFPVEPGKNLRLTAWVLTEGGKGKGVGAAFLDFFGEDRNSPPVIVNSQEELRPDRPFWPLVKMEVPVPLEARRAVVRWTFFADEGRMFLDDCSLRPEGKELLENPGFD